MRMERVKVEGKEGKGKNGKERVGVEGKEGRTEGVRKG